MSTPEDEDLCRISVLGPHSRVDLAIPVRVPFADLLPTVVAYAGGDLPDQEHEHEGWVLQRIDQPPFPPEATPAEIGLRHGETLHLRPRGGELPGVSVHDRTDPLAAGQDEGSDRWGVEWSRIRGQTAFVPSAGGLAVLLWWSDVAWGVRAALAGCVCALALAGARFFSRAWPAIVLAVTSLSFALLTAVLCVLRGAGPRPLSPAEWAYALLAVVPAAAVAARVEAGTRDVWLGCAGAAAVGAATAGATAVWSPVPAAGTAAVALAVVLGLGAAAVGPRTLAPGGPPGSSEASGSGESSSTERGGESDAQPLMTVCTVVLTLVGVVTSSVLAVSGGRWGRLACALAAVQLMLGARRFGGGVRRAALVGTGALGLALAAATGTGDASSALSFALAAVLLIVSAALAFRYTVAGPLPDHAAYPAYLRRLQASPSATRGEVMAWLALVAVAGVLLRLYP
ncbi:EsaB/YukD family protein [Streptomyces cellulosae]|uniref:EsaB/YukD family protein n=1 Tax=Streptomyces cellulosae TaxID=1968 RepID=A0ABW7XUX2_STRCE